MPHLDPDRLTVLALGEQAADQADTDHLAGCDGCRAELDVLVKVAVIARDTQDVRDLPSPPDSVWARIAAETIAGETAGAGVGGAGTAGTPAGASGGGAESRPMRLPRPRRPAAVGGRRMVAACLCALAVGVLGTIGVGRWLGRDTGQVIAQAQLAAQPSAPAGAHGTARIVDAGGHLQVQVNVTGVSAQAGYLTVWIFDGRNVMIPLGSPGPAPLNLPPAATDLDVFHIIDVSAQQLGEQQHGRSLLRGPLLR